MLEHVPHWLGKAMEGLRAGAEKPAIFQGNFGDDIATIELTSPAFADAGRLPVRFTADGEGISPPLLWREIPEGTQSLVLLVEDPDAPAPQPLVHAIVCGLSPDETMLPEGGIRADGDGTADGSDVGRNSYLREGWLPPDPPTGHGVHRYAFQLFALGQVPDLGPTPGRAALLEAIEGHVLAAGLLVGTYSRGEQAMPGSASGSMATA